MSTCESLTLGAPSFIGKSQPPESDRIALSAPSQALGAIPRGRGIYSIMLRSRPHPGGINGNDCQASVAWRRRGYLAARGEANNRALGCNDRPRWGGPHLELARQRGCSAPAIRDLRQPSRWENLWAATVTATNQRRSYRNTTRMRHRRKSLITIPVAQPTRAAQSQAAVAKSQTLMGRPLLQGAQNILAAATVTKLELRALRINSIGSSTGAAAPVSGARNLSLP